MAKLGELTGPVMGSATCLQSYGTKFLQSITVTEPNSGRAISLAAS